MKKAIVIGSGNIGRGLNAYLLSKNNFQINFVDTNEKIINLINENKKYNVISLETKPKINEIKNFQGFHLQSQSKKIVDLITETNIIFISIGFANLKKLSSFLGYALSKRQNKVGKLNIVAIENGINASTELKKHIEKYFFKNNLTLSKNITFCDCIVDRIIPKQKNNNLDVFVEPFYELVIDQKKWLGEKLKFIDYSNDINKFITRKLFMLNGTHTFIAWNCIIKKYKYIHQFTHDFNLAKETKKILKEYGDIIISKYNFSKNEIQLYQQKIWERLSNPNIKDDALRVGRSVITKISPNNRLSSAIKIAINKNLDFQMILKAISLPFLNLNFEDQELQKLKNEIHKWGKHKTIVKYTSLPLEIFNKNIIN